MEAIFIIFFITAGEAKWKGQYQSIDIAEKNIFIKKLFMKREIPRSELRDVKTYLIKFESFSHRLRGIESLFILFFHYCWGGKWKGQYQKKYFFHFKFF